MKSKAGAESALKTQARPLAGPLGRVVVEVPPPPPPPPVPIPTSHTHILENACRLPVLDPFDCSIAKYHKPVADLKAKCLDNLREPWVHQVSNLLSSSTPSSSPPPKENGLVPL